MARTRLLKPGFFTNEQLAELPALTRIVFEGLWVLADKAGRLEDRPKRIKAEIMPYDDYDVDTALSQLAQGSDPFIQRYAVDGRRLIQVRGFRSHQSPHHTEKDSVFPEPPLNNGSATEEQLAAHIHTPVSESVSVSEPPKEKKTTKRFEVPTSEQVAAYCVERKNAITAEQFVDHYAARGWVLSNGRKMVDWQAAVRTWEKNGFQHNRQGAKPIVREYRQITYEQFKAHHTAGDFLGKARVEEMAGGFQRVYGQLKGGRKVESNTDPEWRPEN